jgi:Dockerin type I domain
MMTMKFKSRIVTTGQISLCVFVTLVTTVAAGADLTSFTAGDLVVLRGGDADHPQQTFSFGEVPVYLDEYSVTVSASGAAASLVGSYPIPSNVLTLPGIGTSSHEGRLNLSGDGQYLDFAGYQQAADPNNARVTDGTGNSSYYQIGQVSYNGSFVHTALDVNVATPQFVRAVYSNDGGEAWVGSKFILPGAFKIRGGLEYVSGLGTAAATTVELQGTTDWRDVQIIGGQLYGGTGSSSVGTHGFYAIGSGAPTDPQPTNTLLGPNSDNSVSGFTMATLLGTPPINGAAGSPNTVYVVGDPSGNPYLGKMYSSGGTPLATNGLSFASRVPIADFTPEGVVSKVDPTNPAWIDLYIQASDGVYFTIDKSGMSNGSIDAATFTKIISNSFDGASNEITDFYGLAFAPGAARLKGDVNLDGHVNSIDLATLEHALTDLHQYETDHSLTDADLSAICDLNGDGKVTNADLQGLINTLRAGGAGSLTAVPEPTTNVLAIVAAIQLAAVAKVSIKVRKSGQFQDDESA